MLECVVNVSEGRSAAVLDDLAAAAGRCLLDRHRDADHNRSVFTLAGPDDMVEQAVRSLARAVVAALDLARHSGVHPRIGTLDVVPFVALDPVGPGDGRPRLVDGPLARAVAARDRFARWAGSELELPCFVYGPPPPKPSPNYFQVVERSLPELRRHAWRELRPDAGPDRPHPRAGACAVGARGVLVAYNLWLAADPASGTDLVAVARRAAAAVRRPSLRTLGLAVAGTAQVSCNLVDPWSVGPGAAYDLVAEALPAGVRIRTAELVGLLPAAVLAAEPDHRQAQLGIGPTKTIEARLYQAGLDGGSWGS